MEVEAIATKLAPPKVSEEPTEPGVPEVAVLHLALEGCAGVLGVFLFAL